MPLSEMQISSSRQFSRSVTPLCIIMRWVFPIVMSNQRTILITHDGCIKLVDFGFAAGFEDMTDFGRGTCPYVSFEARVGVDQLRFYACVPSKMLSIGVSILMLTFRWSLWENAHLRSKAARCCPDISRH